jgi:RNA ligase
MMADTFPSFDAQFGNLNMGNLIATLRRECRGIIFDSKTGEILRRPFHKFFNVNERDETQDHSVDLSRPHAILEKLDGSMIAPFIVGDKLIWGTKMGATDVAKPVEDFVDDRYIDFAVRCIAKGYTPIFEWCSRKQCIVLDYSEDQLVLTAIRNMHTGVYTEYHWMQKWEKYYDIPVVRAFEPQSDMKAFIEYVRDMEDLEGFVVRFNDGHMIKLKCDWYVQIHKAKEAILQDRNIVELILDDKLDDIKAHLPAEDRDRLTQFESGFNHAVFIITNDIRSEMRGIKDMDRKTFALTVAPHLDPFVRPIIFKNFDGSTFEKIEADVRDTIRNNLGRTVKYEAIRDAWFPGLVFNG